ncbi:MAG: aspartate--tRNA(Asn) ligase, partial [Actinomycetota bacterium]|nr:aspartate--tRNA(Asn) ligase [Actinomycetota bacterium]
MVADLGYELTGSVRLCGWVERVITQPGGQLVILRDRTGTVPLRMGLDLPVCSEEAIEVIGTIGPDDAGGLAVRVEDVAVRGAIDAELPITPESALEDRLDWRFLDLRRPRNRLIFEVQTTAEQAMRTFWAEHGFLELHSPKFRPNPNRTGRELFSVPYFDRQAYLVQSPQFYKQMAMAAGFERVFEIGPVFRANPVATARHDTEFTSVDIEMSWIDSDEDVMAFEERWLRHVISVVKTEHGDDIARAFGVDVMVPDLPFPRVALDEARRIVEASAAGLAQPPGDLDMAGE